MDGARRGERERRARGRRPTIASSIPPSNGDVVWAKMPGFSLAGQPLRKKTEGSGDPYIHVWWPWNAIIQQFVYIPELLNFARMQYGIIMQISMQMASNCYCCGDDLSSGEKKKRRRPLSSAGTLQTPITLTSEQQRTIDVSKLHTGYVCRSCAGLLERYASLYQQIKDNIKAALPVLPTQEAGFETTLAPPPRVRHVVQSFYGLTRD